MSARSARLVGSLSLEVWLGPLEGLRCTKMFDADPYVVRIGRRPIDEKRGVRNDLILGDAERISGFHAEVRYAGGALFLKDLNSTNGTYAAARRVAGEVEIKSADVFLLSTTPIQALLGDEARAPAEPPMSVGEISATVSLQKMLAAVRASARRRGEGYADTRHLADALLRSPDPAIQACLASAEWSAEKALEELWGPGLFRGRSEWIFRFLEAPGEAAKPVEPVLTTRVNAIFGAAARRLSGMPAVDAAAQAAGSLLSILLTSPGPVGAWLAEHQVSGPRLTVERRVGSPDRRQARPSRVSKTIQISAADLMAAKQAATLDATARPERGAPVVEAPSAPASPPPLPASTGDVVLDQRARVIAQGIEEAAVLYRFSTPDDRRSAIKTIVTRALAAIAPENRGRILSQIRVQFPVTSAVPAEAPGEAAALRRQVESLERRLSELSAARPAEEKEAAASPPPSAGSWQSVLSPGSAPKDAPPEEAVLKELVEFARRMEKFTLGLIQSVTMPGSATASFRLPAYRYTLDSVLKSLREGKPFDRERLPAYLRELERWQVAILAGHHASSREWFQQYWSKLGPAAIESAASKPATWKLQGGAADFWNRYKEGAKGLDAEVVQDQVLQIAYRVAQEEYEKLTKRRAQ